MDFTQVPTTKLVLQLPILSLHVIQMNLLFIVVAWYEKLVDYHNASRS